MLSLYNATTQHKIGSRYTWISIYKVYKNKCCPRSGWLFFFVSPFLDCLLMSFWLLYLWILCIYIHFCHLPILAFWRKMLVAYWNYCQGFKEHEFQSIQLSISTEQMSCLPQEWTLDSPNPDSWASQPCGHQTCRICSLDYCLSLALDWEPWETRNSFVQMYPQELHSPGNVGALQVSVRGLSDP